MRKVLVVCSALALALIGSCTSCGSGGPPCMVDTDCPTTSQVCASGTCIVGTRVPGGILLPDGGFISNSDGGSQIGPDGGPCDNLVCRQAICPASSPTTITGSVYDPSGQVALYNAIVYVPNKQPNVLPQGMSCDVCGSLVSGAPIAITLTGPDGKFVLKDVPYGQNVPLVLQVGKWRRQVTIPFDVQACTSQPFTDVSKLHLPKDRGEGDIPQMAISTGSADRFECLLRKMGISYSEMTSPLAPNGGGRVHFYKDNGLNNDAGFLADTALLADAGTLTNYDVVLLPCRGGERFTAAGQNPYDGYTQNLIDYTGAGGRVFTTHYGYVWMAFGNQPWPRTAFWTPDPGQGNNPPQSPFNVNVNQSFPKGDAFAQWLNFNGASTTFGILGVNESRHDVSGVDGGTTAWLSARNPNHPNYLPDGGLSVQHLTFNTPWDPPGLPDGGPGKQCGRVVFSDFHVTANALQGGSGTSIFPRACSPNTTMTPQEKALVFMLFDVSSCVQSDTTAPTTCAPVGATCTGAEFSNCCSGLECQTSAGVICDGISSCSCQPVIQ